MRIFALALVPGGNILVHLNAAKRDIPDFLDHPEGQGLPDGIYLGFFSSNNRNASDALRKGFRQKAQDIFKDIPGSLKFGKIQEDGASVFLAPLEGDLPPASVEQAAQIAVEAGLSVLADPPFKSGLGFFIGKNVTPRRIDAFSFSYMDAVLMEICTRDPRWASASWSVIARQGRRRSPSQSMENQDPHGEKAFPVL